MVAARRSMANRVSAGTCLVPHPRRAKLL